MKKIIGLTTLILFSVCCRAQQPYVTSVPYINSGLVKPVVITHCNDSRLFIVEQDGRIRIIINDTLMSTPFLDINPQVQSLGTEQGLLGLAFDPDFPSNGYFYVNYINNQGNTTLSRYSVDPADSNQALANSEVILKVIYQPYTNHNGGDIEFGPDGYLYVPLGDGGSAYDPQNRAQNQKELLGKILRLDVSHGDQILIPPDNPHVNDTAWLPEIWSLGLRNPWKTSFDRFTNDYWIGDVGQDVWEEIDYVKDMPASGANFGWRCYEATHPHITTGCQPAGYYTAPVYEYQHALGNCSVTGGLVYRGAAYGNLFRHYLFADFCIPQFRTLKKQNDTTFAYLAHSSWTGAGISTFGEDAAGNVYVGNLYNGQIRKITDTTSCAPAAFLAESDTLIICAPSGLLRTPAGNNFNYSWMLNGNILPDTGHVIQVIQNGLYAVQVTNPVTGCQAEDSVFVMLTPIIPVVTVSGLDTSYCSFDAPVSLTGSPAGGVFYGQGISANQFSPAMAGAGPHLIQYNYTGTNGCVFKEILSTVVSACSAINENSTVVHLEIFPNPTEGIVSLKLKGSAAVQSSVTLMDISGRVFDLGTIALDRGEVTTIDISNFQAGLYILTIKNQQGVSTMKLLRL